MALEVAVGTVTISTGAVGTTFTVSGLSFQPKALFFSWCGRATAGQAEADHMFGAGFAVSTSSRRAYTSQGDHALSAIANDVARYNDCAIATLTVLGAIDGKADLDAITADGFRLIVDDQFAVAQIVGYVAYGGADLSTAEIVDFSEPGATGNQDVATTNAVGTAGVDDKAVIILGGPDAAFGTPTVWSTFMIGLAAGDTPVNAIMAGAGQDAVGTSVTWGYARTGECVANLGAADTVSSRASLSGWNVAGNGFRLNWAEVDAATVWEHSALVMSGGRWQVGDNLTNTGVSNQVEATSYVPNGILVISGCKAASVADTTTANDERSIGAAQAAAARWYSSMIDKDAQAIQDIGVAFNTDAMYGNQSTAATVVIEGLMDIVSFDATPSFTFVMDDADPVAAWFGYLLAADTPAAGGATYPGWIGSSMGGW